MLYIDIGQWEHTVRGAQYCTIRPFGAGANSLIQRSLSEDQAAQQLEANSFVRYLPDPQNASEDTQVVCIDQDSWM